ncbi:MAG: aminoacyl-tRNA hydrolase [Planctomycetia bacterium]|nr:aminoacyl-tRNA hydrolase [Planctomycetia bacterium]
MNVLVGLGNPGKKYEGTRHNVGWLVIGEMAVRHGAARPKVKFEAEIAEVPVAGKKLLLVAPQTFMNASGRSVRQLVDFYQLAASEILVVCDDINLPLAKLRMRRSGSSGGQKGLENVISHLGTQDVPRLRIGVGQPTDGRDSADYVLDRFSKAEMREIEPAVRGAADAVEIWIAEGIDRAMNQFNVGYKNDDDKS